MNQSNDSSINPSDKPSQTYQHVSLNSRDYTTVVNINMCKLETQEPGKSEETFLECKVTTSPR